MTERKPTPAKEPLRADAHGTTPMVVDTTAAPLGAVIRVLDLPSVPRALHLRSGACVIGSSPGCDIVLSQPTVSRKHAQVELVPEGVSVRDMGSRNGIFYLGKRVEKIVLPLGGRINLGAATVVIDVDTEALTQELHYDGSMYRGMVGVAHPMRRLFALLRRLEGSLATVLIEGESGVGKELVARALHEGSRVSSGPFLAVNCGAMPRELVASELFGHRRGAFTGALEERKGAFESADRGTLFLDELGELPLEVQPALLRALELGEVRAVGHDQSKRVQVRVVAATNRDLEAEVRAGRFREDLFYRLAVVRLTVPPLRERPEDIDLLARRFASAMGLSELPATMVEELRRRAWPGNVRELQNAVQAYAALGQLPSRSRRLEHSLDASLRELIDLRRSYSAQKDQLTDRFTMLYLEALMAESRGNQSEAARMSGLTRGYLGRLLVKYGLSRTGAGGQDESNEESK